MTGDGTEFCGPDFYAVGESAGHLGADESSATRLPCLGAGYAALCAPPRHDSGGKTALATPLPRAPRPSWSFPTARYAWRLTSWCWVREPAPQGEESHS